MLKCTCTFLALIWSVCSVSTVMAQNRQGARQMITPQEADSLRVDLLNREVHLSREESKNFWPVYDQYLSKLESLQQNFARDNAADRKNIDHLSSAELNQFINREFDFQQKKLDLKREYDQIFRKILPIIKLAHFYIAQDKFSSQLIRYRISKGLTRAATP